MSQVSMVMYMLSYITYLKLYNSEHIYSLSFSFQTAIISAMEPSLSLTLAIREPGSDSTTRTMEPSEQSSRRGKRKINDEGIHELSNKTLERIRKIYPQDRVHHGTVCNFYDMRTKGYEWLLPGWVAEERRTKGGSVYRVKILFVPFVRNYWIIIDLFIKLFKC